MLRFASLPLSGPLPILRRYHQVPCYTRYYARQVRKVSAGFIRAGRWAPRGQPPIHAAATRPSAISVLNTPGTAKKYRQVRTAMTTKLAAKAHRSTDIADSCAGGGEPQRHASN